MQHVAAMCVLKGADLADGAYDDIGCKGAHTHNCGKARVQTFLVLHSAAATLSCRNTLPGASAVISRVSSAEQ